ncbi:MAG: DNA-processing protein DprA [Thermogutta sp.]
MRMRAAATMSDGDAYSTRLLQHLRLTLIDGVGPRLYHLLLGRFGSPEEVFSAPENELLAVSGVGRRLAEKLRNPPPLDEAKRLLEECTTAGIDILWPEHIRYPRFLKEIPDPPLVLFTRGEIRSEDELAVAIVGTRHASTYGLKMAETLAAGLARSGVTIVSGLARGIDAAAHRGALTAGGRTIAVLGSGVQRIYPPEHKSLADEILEHGALLSEAPPHAPPHGGMFPQRNRIISGLSVGVVIVEAGETSGALITARHAVEQNREVFAVPGRADSPNARGCNRLLRDGAKWVETPEDILEELGPLIRPVRQPDGTTVRRPVELQLSPLEKQVLQAVRDDPTPIDEVIAVTGLTASQVLATLSVLEMRRVLRRVGGTNVVRL